MSSDSNNNLRIKLQDSPMNPEAPWQDDRMGRQAFGNTLEQMLSLETNPLTVAINGVWGSGKTFFFTRWAGTLRSKGFEVVQFNAWEDDYLEDALLSITGQLYIQYKDNDFKEIIKTAREIVLPLLKKFAGNAVANMVSKVSCGTISSEKNDYQSANEQMFEEYETQLNSRDEFRKKMTEFARKIKEKTNKPLIFIIDELDRCRPTFSIEVLERVKHFFEIPNIIFVFGVDMKNLKQAIQAVYGNIDVDNYLRRFFDMTIQLPNQNPQTFIDSLVEQYHENLMKDKVMMAIDNKDDSNVSRLLQFLVLNQDFSLREIQNFMRYLVMVKRRFRHWPLDMIEFFVFLKVVKPTIYHDFFRQKILAKDVIDFLAYDLLKPYHKGDGTRVLLEKDLIYIRLYQLECKQYPQIHVYFQSVARNASPHCHRHFVTREIEQKLIDVTDIRNDLAQYTLNLSKASLIIFATRFSDRRFPDIDRYYLQTFYETLESLGSLQN